MQTFFHGRAQERLTVLAYHGITDSARFAQQLAYLGQTMHPLTLDDALAVLQGKIACPKRAVLLTFDDGERTVVDRGLPLLQARNIPAVVFVVAGLLNTNQPFWWTEVEALLQRGGAIPGFDGASPAIIIRHLKQQHDDERLAALMALRRTASVSAPPTPQLQREELVKLVAAGITIGNHTVTHPCLDQCSDQKIYEEIAGAHTQLTTILGHAPKVFAYPNGNLDRRATKVVAQLGYEAAFLFDHRLSPVPPRDPLRISRVRVNSTTSLTRFKLIVHGIHPAIHHMLGRQ